MAKKQIATFLGPNQGLSIVGNHAYAYSGNTGVTDSTTTLLNFDSGKKYIKCRIQPFYMSTQETDDISIVVKFNGQSVAGATLEGSGATAVNPFEVFHMIIPPLTTVLVTAANKSASTSRTISVAITGRVYA